MFEPLLELATRPFHLATLQVFSFLFNFIFKLHFYFLPQRGSAVQTHFRPPGGRPTVWPSGSRQPAAAARHEVEGIDFPIFLAAVSQQQTHTYTRRHYDLAQMQWQWHTI